MIRTSVRQALKRALPSPVTRALAGFETYLRRLAACRLVAHEIHGRSPVDRKVLWRSMAMAPIDMLRDLGRWREPMLDADAEVVAKGLGAFCVRRRTDDLASIVPSNYTAIFEVIRRHVREGDTVIDGGANMGAVTVFLARCVGSRGRVIAIEMMPDTAARLRRNLDLNGLDNVTLVEQALAERADEIVVAHVEPGVHGQASIAAVDRGVREQMKVEVRTTTLDAIMAGLDEVAFVKLDLEDAEPQALRGASASLCRMRAILFESWRSDGGETGVLLRQAGFEVSPVDGRNLLALRRPSNAA